MGAGAFSSIHRPPALTSHLLLARRAAPPIEAIQDGPMGCETQLLGPSGERGDSRVIEAQPERSSPDLPTSIVVS